MTLVRVKQEICEQLFSRPVSRDEGCALPAERVFVHYPWPEPEAGELQGEEHYSLYDMAPPARVLSFSEAEQNSFRFSGWIERAGPRHVVLADSAEQAAAIFRDRFGESAMRLDRPDRVTSPWGIILPGVAFIVIIAAILLVLVLSRNPPPSMGGLALFLGASTLFGLRQS